MTLDDIGKQAEEFFEFPTENRDHVTTTSCVLFARHIAEQATAYKQEHCDQLAHDVLRLEQELAESRQSNKDFCETVTPQLSRLLELESRYAGAVEVEGIVDGVAIGDEYDLYLELDNYLPQDVFCEGQRVKVLVLPERVADASKTMKEVE